MSRIGFTHAHLLESSDLAVLAAAPQLTESMEMLAYALMRLDRRPAAHALFLAVAEISKLPH